MKKIRNIITVFIFAILMFSVSAMCYFGQDKEFSTSERRELAKKPKLTFDTIMNGDFATDFEYYTTDQFPFRDKFRSAKAVFSTMIMHKLDNNGLYMAEGHLSKISEEKNDYMMDYSANLFKKIIDKNVDDENTKVYFSIVPDKNYYLAEKYGYPSLDYANFISEMRDKTEYMSYIDITKKLTANDFYRTDSHWKQEKIVDVANFISKEMGRKINPEYKTNILANPFYGVYAGQSAIPVDPDVIKYLTNDTLDNATITYYDTGKPEVRELYNMEKAYGKDPYEMYLSGSSPLVTIDNPSANTDRELVMFRDSFGSSLAPLLVEGYKKVTVVDIRYMQSSYVGNFVDFENCDVLFIYSAELLNNSLAMK